MRNVVKSIALLLTGVTAASLLVACGAAPADDAGDAEPGRAEPVVGETSATDDEVEKAVFTDGTFGATCTDDEQGTVLAAEAQAIRYLDAIARSESAIRNGSATTKDIFRAHFASTGSASLDFVFGTYRGVRNNIVDTFYVCSFDGSSDCDGSGFGGDLPRAVTSGFSTVVRLCPLFFQSDPRTQAQTLIHELTHQDRTSPDGVGTDDLVGASTRNAHQYSIYAPRCAEGTCVVP